MKSSLISGVLVVLGAATVNAVPVTYSDGTFPDAAWSAQKFLDGDFTSFQVLSGGNPNEFRRTDHFGLDAGQSIFVVQTLSTATYDPSIDGAIDSIGFGFDLKFLGGTTGTSQVGYRLALEQQGSFYSTPSFFGIALGPGNGLPGTQWDSFAFGGLTATDFAKIGGPGVLDFSATGGLITFGFMTNNTVNLDNTGTSSGIDNWAVSVTPRSAPVPEASSVWLLTSGLAALFLSVCTRRPL